METVREQLKDMAGSLGSPIYVQKVVEKEIAGTLAEA